MMKVVRGAASCAAGLLGLLAAVELAAAYVRRTATDASATERYIRILSSGHDEGGEFLDFAADSFASHPGQLSISAPHEDELVRLKAGEVLAGSLAIRRYVASGNFVNIVAAGKGRISGHMGATPLSFGFDCSSVDIEGYPAWLIAGEGQNAASNVWAIHVHGLGSSRSQVLRGIGPFRQLGITSLVPSYATSLDNGRNARRRSHLGTTEWTTVAAAQRYAVKAGAQQIIYVGWSLGSSLALRAAEAFPEPVAGAVLVSPALDWLDIIRTGVTAKGVPDWVAKVIMSRFNHIFLRHSPPINWGDMPGTPVTGRPAIPLLIIHGAADRTVPIWHSRDLASAFGESVALVEFQDAHHTLEWNTNPELWERSVRNWWGALRENRHPRSCATIGGEHQDAK